MADPLDNPHQAELAHRFAVETLRALVNAGFLAYFAGGCVRDRLRGQTPDDYDIATNATPDQVQRLFGKNRTQFVGASFGVVCVRGILEGLRHQVEVATFRSDGPYSDGRRPDTVEFTTPEHDARRRDFTINAIFYDPIQDIYIDYVGGSEDIRNGLVRAVGDPLLRFHEDKLRMLRAVRFAARFGYRIDADTESAILRMASTLEVVSPERISMELHKMLTLPNNAWALEQLDRLQLLSVVLPELAQAWRDEHLRQDSLALLRILSSKEFCTVTAAVCWDWMIQSGNRSDRISRELRLRWRLSNAESQCIDSLLKNAALLVGNGDLPWSRLQPILASSDGVESLTLAIAIRLRNREQVDDLNRYRSFLDMPSEQLDPAPLLNGVDLLQLGMAPGPTIASFLKQVRALQLDGVLNTHEEAIQWVRSQTQ